MKRNTWIGMIAGCLASALGAQANPRAVQFSNDAGTGLSPLKHYTHAIDAGSNSAMQNPVIKGVQFTSTTSRAGTLPGDFGWSGLPATPHPGGNEGNIATLPTEQIYKLLYDFFYDTGHGTLELTGLEPGRCYEIRLYHRAWGVGDNRTQIFTFRPDNTTAHSITNNPDAAKIDQYIAYRYVAADDGTLRMNYDMDNPNATYHLYGLSNELVGSLRADAATGIGQNNATFTGMVYPEGMETTVSVWWGVAANDLPNQATSAGTFTDAAAFQIDADNFPAGQTIYYRVVLDNGHNQIATDLQSFITRTSAPVITALPPSVTGDTFASADGDLVYTGSGETADVTLFWGDADPAVSGGDWFASVELGALSGGVFTTNALNHLAIGGTYYYCFRAVNATDEVWSNVVTFRTHGAAEFSEPRAAAFSNGAKIWVELADSALDAVTVTCWTGADSGALTPVKTWPPTASGTFEFGAQIEPGASLRYCFSGVNSLGTVWTATNTVTAGNRDLVWDTMLSAGAWDTSAKSWHYNTSLTAFAIGDSVTISRNADISLGQNIDVDRITLSMSDGQNITFNNARDLWMWNGIDGTAASLVTLYAPRLRGPGALRMTGGTLSLANPENDFTGGVTFPQGTLNLPLTTASATTLGSGDIRLGASDMATAYVTVYVTGEGALYTPGTLFNIGPYNNARLILSDNTSATFNRLEQTRGAFLYLSGNGTLRFTGMPADKLPPSFAFNRPRLAFGAVHADGTVGLAPTTLLANATAADYADVTAQTTLNADAHAYGLQLKNNIDLNGHTLHLGHNGKAGIILDGDRTITGSISTGDNDLHLFSQGFPRLRFNITGTGATYVSGDAIYTFHGSSLPSGGLYIQENLLLLESSGDLALNGPLSGMGELTKRDPYRLSINTAATAPSRIRLIAANAGELLFAGGEHFIRQLNINTESDNGRVVISNATVNVNTALLGHYAGTNHQFVVTNGGRFNSAGTVEYGAIGSYGRAIVNNGHVVINGLFSMGQNGVANHNQLILTNSATFKANSFNVGHSGSGNRLILDGADFYLSGMIELGFNLCSSNTLTAARSKLFFDNTGNENIRMGTFQASTHHLFNLESGSVVTNRGGLHIGHYGAYNTFRLASGAFMRNDGPIYVGRHTDAHDNRLVLAGGKLDGSTLIVANANIIIPEIQLNGLPEIAEFSGAVTFAPGSKISPVAVKNALPGTYTVLRAANIDNGAGNLTLDVPENEIPRWKFEVNNTELRVTYRSQRTLFMVR